MDQVKEAFKKVKEDINYLKSEFSDIKKELSEIQLSILQLSKDLANNFKNNPTDQQTDNQTHSSTQNKTDIPLNNSNFTNIKTKNTSSTDSSTHILPFQALKQPNIDISIGNKGVSTDRQTDQQTDNQTHFIRKNPVKTTKDFPLISQTTLIDTGLILTQLDAVKKDLRIKIKRLTNQEMFVFSSIYQFEDQGEIIDYTFLSNKLSLSESSIRDYIQRISQKGLPLIKEKINNKKVILHISDDFRKLTSLDTLLKLRDL